MKRVLICVCLAACATVMHRGVVAFSQEEVVDRIVAKVEDDIILLSQVQLLEKYQTLMDEKHEPEDQIVKRLIDQWIVNREIQASRFPPPSEADIDRSMRRMERSFSSPEELRERERQLGLTSEDVRKIVTNQVYYSNYLDSRFRPTVQIDDAAIQKFYDDVVLPRAKRRGANPPTLENARDYIQEALVQRGINEQAERWLNESRSRLHIEIFLSGDDK